MSKGDDKRKKIFEKYSSNLQFLIDNGFITGISLKYDKTYICPICMDQFSSEDLDVTKSNHLTLEDVPPKSLGGRPCVLTCKKCNNAAGHKIDSQLYARMYEMDQQKFVSGSSFKARFRQDDEIVQGEVTVGEDGKIKVKNSYKNNNRAKLDTFIDGISPKTGNPVMNIEFIPSKIDFKGLQVALLKTAYLLCFEKFGYAVINDACYNIVREQIQNPNLDIYPTQFWFQGPFNENQYGVHISTNVGLECFMVIFPLKSHTNRVFGAILPIKTTPIIEIVAGFHASLALGLDQPAYFDRHNHPQGYLDNLAAVTQISDAVTLMRSR